MSPDGNGSWDVGVVSLARFSDFWRARSGEVGVVVVGAVGIARGASVAVGPRFEAIGNEFKAARWNRLLKEKQSFRTVSRA